MSKTKNESGCSAVLSTDVLGGNEWYTEDGQPIKCWKCGCTEQREVVISMVDVFQGMGPVCEYEVFCVGCGEGIGYWAYGSFNPGYMANLPPNT